MLPIVLIMRPRWPATRAELGHVIVAGLLMHAMHLGGQPLHAVSRRVGGHHRGAVVGAAAADGADRIALDGRAACPAAVAGDRARTRRRSARGMAQDRRARNDARQPARGHHLAAGGDRRHALSARVLPARRPAHGGAGAVHRLGRGAGAARLADRRFQGELGVADVRRDRVPGDRRVDTRGQRAAHADAPRRGHARHQPALPDADLRGGARVCAVPGDADDALHDRHRHHLRGRRAGRLEAPAKNGRRAG